MHDSPGPGAVGRRPRSDLGRVFLAAAPSAGRVSVGALRVAAGLDPPDVTGPTQVPLP